MIYCPLCQSITRQVKATKNSAGVQLYRCMHCNRLYVPQPEPRSGMKSVPKQASDKPVAADGVPGTANPNQEMPPTLVRAKPQDTVQAVASAHSTNQELAPTLVGMNAQDAALTVTPTNSNQDLPPTLLNMKVQGAAPTVRQIATEDNRGLLARVMDWTSTTNSWGRLPEVALLQSAGLLFLALTFGGARAFAISSQVFLWIGLAALIVPTAYRLASAEPNRRERIGLVLLLGMSLYLVKVMHSPTAFTFPDELSHLRNVNEILETHRLFQENPIQPVTALYPGLPTVTSTVISLSGLSTFAAGIVVIGVARLILFLALFLLYEHVSGSARVAGLATVLYMANPNFLYWTSEYAYEPLALPLVVFVLLAVAKREMTSDRRHHVAWTVAALFGLLTVVITHHMSSYILTGLLIALVGIYRIGSRGAQKGPRDLAVIALLVTAFWLIFVANLTINYLSPVLVGAIRSIFNLVAEEEQSRELFKSASTGSVAPLWERVFGMGAVILIALGLPFGLFEIWKKYRDRMFAFLLAAIALAYLPMQMLRFTKAGWETANRSSEFLFIGIGFVLALGFVNFGLTKWPGNKTQAALAILTVTLFFGGLIAGWPPRARLPRPYVVYAGSHTIKPQVVSVSEWFLANLGIDNRMAASKADAKILGAYGQYPFTGSAGGMREILFSEGLTASERKSLSKRQIEYIVSDRKMISWDHMIGYYFYNHQYGSSSELELVPPEIFEKFDDLRGVTRMLDAGDIVVYDIGSYLATSNDPEEETTSEKTLPVATHNRTPAAVSGKTPKLTPGFRTVQLSNASDVHARTLPSSCDAKSTDVPISASMRWELFLGKVSQAECVERSLR